MSVTPGVPCPACGGPPLHPGVCVDIDGQVLPAYAELARMWEEGGRSEMTLEEMLDLDGVIEAIDEDDEDEQRFAYVDD